VYETKIRKVVRIAKFYIPTLVQGTELSEENFKYRKIPTLNRHVPGVPMLLSFPYRAPLVQ